MASTAESMRRSPFAADHHATSMHHKSIPILPSSNGPANSPGHTPSDPMDVTPTNPTGPMGPPAGTNQSNASGEQQAGNGQHVQQQNGKSESEQHQHQHPTTNGNSGPAIGAAAAAQQPKVVQTAFIHKLYNMLEDQSIQHLISWSSTNESFVMSPSTEFSKVLSSYFKHTNISSFVRQLNMYGFHKVSDVFHTGSPDSPLWEFKHGNGNFKRGDLVGLREIKRRASRHVLTHRDSFSTGPKASGGQPGTPVEPMPDPVESRFSALEHNLYEVYSRLARAEDSYAYLNSKCQYLTDGITRAHQWNVEMAKIITAMVPDADNPIARDIAAMQRDMARHIEAMRSYDDPQEPLPSARQPYFANLHNDTTPLSPRQMAQDTDSRRPSLGSNSLRGTAAAAAAAAAAGSSSLRPPQAPASLAISPRRYGSIGAGSSYSPSSARNPVPPPPPPPPVMPHPLSTASSPPTNLPRRHTSADIRLHGWQGAPPPPPPPPPPPHPAAAAAAAAAGHSPYASGQNSTQWPSSPHRAPVDPADLQIRNALAQYELPRGPSSSRSRQATPPAPDAPAGAPDSGGGGPGGRGAPGWSLPAPRFPQFKTSFSMPPTRRSSMASNVHSLLNPAETAEREDEDGPPDERKRKRLG
ncbi:HSF-type DNA-binding-domain-containing protein [Lineolata rhizophorae]|uniref:HSF-type DNA-binding-domain-containing protein n=1 Tax=Lineolata rhizophorae TaxID=578093 RepID=A0A6A6P2H6_9PEZI|nr:HSF-type DNA-binding-domain-containing protein [Lineolata rhizophorae]